MGFFYFFLNDGLVWLVSCFVFKVSSDLRNEVSSYEVCPQRSLFVYFVYFLYTALCTHVHIYILKI